MKQARVMLLVAVAVSMVALAARAEDVGKPYMSDFVRGQIKGGRMTFVPGAAVFDKASPGVGRIQFGTTTQVRNVEGSVTVQVLSGGTESVRTSRQDGDMTWNTVLGLNTNVTVISQSLSQPMASGGIQTLQVFSLTQSTAGNGSVSLSVIDPKTRQAVVSLSEKSFLDLWSKHPDEMRMYVVPVFKQLDLEGVFFVSQEEAVRVFDPVIRGLPDVKGQVEAILPQLNDDSPDVRGRAIEQLVKIGPPAVPIVNALDMKSQPLQTRIALKAFLEQMKDMQAQVADNRLDDPDYLMQCLAVDDPQIVGLAHKRLEKIAGKSVEFDEKATVSQREEAVQKMRIAAMKPG